MLSREAVRAALESAGVQEWAEPEFGCYKYEGPFGMVELRLVRLLDRRFLLFATAGGRTGMRDTADMLVEDVADLIRLTIR